MGDDDIVKDEAFAGEDPMQQASGADSAPPSGGGSTDVTDAFTRSVMFDSSASHDVDGSTDREASEHRSHDGPGKPGEVLPNIGDFIVEELVGSGGMGLVYRAYDPKLNRTVAIKVLRSGSDATESELTRFEREARVIAGLRHPHIVQIYEVGKTNTLTYIVLEFMNGGSLKSFLHGNPLPERYAIELILKLTDAVAAAHSQKVVHRDLKPGNVLISIDRDEGAKWRPGTLTDLTQATTRCKIADFGLAKELNVDDDQTVTGMVVGTPRYAAPEQLAGETKAIGPATDVYALGTMLFEFVTGTPVFQTSSTAELIRAVRDREAVSPRQLNPGLSRDLETICLKCLQKSPNSRYASAAELRDDLTLLANNQPIVARPTSRRERIIKWIRRNPAWTAALLTGFLSLFAVTTLAVDRRYRARLTTANAQLSIAQRDLLETNAELLKQNRALDAARAVAEQARTEVSRFRYSADMQLASRTWEDGDITPMRNILGRYRIRSNQAGQIDPRGWEWHYLDRMIRNYAKSIVGKEATYSPDGKWLAVSRGDSIHLLDPQSLQTIRMLENSVGSQTGLAFSGDSKRIIAGMQDTTFGVWNVGNGKRLTTFAKHSYCGRAALNHSGSHAMTMGYADDRTAMLWVVDTGEVLAQWDAKEAISYPGDFAFSPDGKTFALGWQLDATVRIGTIDDPKNIRQIAVGNQRMIYHGYEPHLAFHPDNKSLYASHGGTIFKISYAEHNGEEPLTLMATPVRGSILTLSRDGQTMITCDPRKHTIDVWDTASGTLRNRRRGHAYDPTSFSLAASSPANAGKLIGISNHNSDVRLLQWDLLENPEYRTIATNFNVSKLAYSPDGTMLAATGYPGKVAIFQDDQWTALQDGSGAAWKLQFSPDSRLLALTSLDGTFRIWDIATGQIRYTLQTPDGVGFLDCNFSFDGRRVVLSDNGKRILVCDVETGDTLETYASGDSAAYDATFLPGTDRVASLANSKYTFWNSDPPRVLTGLGVSGIEFDADGSQFATLGGFLQNDIYLVDMATGRLLTTMIGHRATASEVKWFDNDRRLVSVGDTNGQPYGTGTIRIWDRFTGQETLRLDSLGSRSVAVHPNGQAFAVTTNGWQIRVFDSGVTGDAVPTR